MQVDNKLDYSISLIRMISTVFVFSCHIMQYLDSPLAWWFNVGVQIFLCMSGYLYGKKKEIVDSISFYKKQFKKILLDYYIVIVPAIIVYFFFSRENISVSSAIRVLLTYGTLKGGGHLWYIPYCLFCYLMTPLLSRLFDKSKMIVVRAILLAVFIIAITETFFNYFNSAWVICYVIGFFLGRLSREGNLTKTYKVASAFFVAVAVITNSIQVLQDYIIRLELDGVFRALYSKYCNYAHVALGVSLFVLLKAFFTRVFKNKFPQTIKSVCTLSDKLSYDVYLIHQFIILGPFSLMVITPYLILNIVVIITIVIIGAFIVHAISSKLQRLSFTEGYPFFPSKG